MPPVIFASWALGCALAAASDQAQVPARPEISAPAEQQATPDAAQPEQPGPRRRGWNDRRRTVKSYAANLGYDGVRVFGRSNWSRLGVGAALTGVAAFADNDGVDFFDRHPWRTLGNAGANAGGTIGVAAVGIGLFSAGRIGAGDRFRAATYDASQAILIDMVYTFGLKVATHRLRPDGSNYQSFPSGHASAAFSWATVLGRHYGPKLGVPAYTLASLIALSRLPHKSHYLSDVVAGAALGHVVGRTVVRGNSREVAAKGAPAKPIVQLAPVFGPRGEPGVGVVVVF
jgi:membrane-associated phospholipid phosphatase